MGKYTLSMLYIYINIYLGELYRPHCDLTGIMDSKGNHPQMAELFRLVNYYKIYIIYCFPGSETHLELYLAACDKVEGWTCHRTSSSPHGCCGAQWVLTSGPTNRPMPFPGHGCDGCHGCHGCHEHFNSFLHFFSSWSRCKLASLQSLQSLQVANPLRGRTRNGWSCLAQSRRGAARPEIHMNSPCSTCHSTLYTLRNGPFIPI